MTPNYHDQQNATDYCIYMTVRNALLFHIYAIVFSFFQYADTQLLVNYWVLPTIHTIFSTDLSLFIYLNFYNLLIYSTNTIFRSLHINIVSLLIYIINGCITLFFAIFSCFAVIEKSKKN